MRLCSFRGSAYTWDTSLVPQKHLQLSTEPGLNLWSTVWSAGRLPATSSIISYVYLDANVISTLTGAYASQNNEDLPDTTPPPRQHLVDDGILAVVAGSDTVSSTATSLIYCLITHPDVYAALKAEVDKYYHPGDDPCNPRHYQDMHYMTAVM